jgi:hypothetical protein
MELIGDPGFERGFWLQNPDASTKDRRIDCKLYLGEESKEDPVWWMAQWWTPFHFAKARGSRRGTAISIDNESRHFLFDPADGHFEMGLDANLEYETLYGGVRKAPSTPWSHFLLEQDFPKAAEFSKLRSLRARLSFRIDECELFHKDEFDPNLHAAQLLWYITINKRKAPYSPAEGEFIWFGLPLFDSRVPHTSFGAFLDVGNAGSTNRLIYNLASDDYLPPEIKIGEWVSVDIDILPRMKEAVAYAKGHGIFKENGELYVNYMNFGWELPGAYKAKASIKGMSLEGETE